MTAAEHQHQCLVRHVLAMRLRDRDGAKSFLDLWETKHKGETKLRADVVEQWRLGNRGKYGDWRTGDAGA